MPHLTIEFSNNLPQVKSNAFLLKMNQAVLASGEFEELDVKTRLMAFDDFLVGTQPQGQAFVHAKLALLSGRSEAVKHALSAQLLRALQEALVWPDELDIQLCVEILEIERASYCKLSLDKKPSYVQL